MTKLKVAEALVGQSSLTSFFACSGTRKRKENQGGSQQTFSKPSPLETNHRLPVPPKKKSKQLFLDLGQKDFCKRITCSMCGMVYDASIEEDEKEHSKACRDFDKGVPFQISKPSIVEKYNHDVIVEIRRTDGLSLRKKLQQVLSIVRRELSFVDSLESGKAQRYSYLYVRNRRVIGVLVAERVQAAYTLLDSNERSTEETTANLGVYQIWVHSRFRGQKVATRLLDAARENMIFGLVVPRNLVAFSSPTEAGIALARNYCGGYALVYDFC